MRQGGVDGVRRALSIRSGISPLPLRQGTGRAVLRGLLAVSLGIVTSVAVVGITKLAVGTPAASDTARLGRPVTDCGADPSPLGPNTISVEFGFHATVQSWIGPSSAVPNAVCVDAIGDQGVSGTG